MSGYADSEKIQYALKTALYRTMQTALSDSASVERSAPLRVFPTNIMKVNIIEAGKGDIGEDGTYVTGHTTAGQTADLSDPESTVKNYKIICPVNNVITSITISALVGYGSSTKSFVDGRGTSGTSYPLKQWFFRGHYSGSGETAFNAANVSYDGLQLAWNSATNDATPTEADIVPHLKYYLQVQTNYTGVSHSSSADNITYEHGLLKGLIGLDSNFVSTIMVAQGEGGPSSSASLGTSGSQAGDFWFTQPTAGILSFYGVTNKVDASTDLATFNTKYPMISYVRYTGETGFGAGTGGGGGGSVTLASADSNVSNMIGGTAQTMTTTSFNFDGNVGINMDSPYFRLHISGSGQNWDTSPGIGFDDFANNKHWYVGTANNITAGDFYIRTCASNSTYPTTANGLTIQHGGNVGIGILQPVAKLSIKHTGGTADTPDSGKDFCIVDTVNCGLYSKSGTSTNGTTITYGLSYWNGSSAVDVDNALVLRNYSGENRVGIGTTSPSQKLDIEGNGGSGTGRIRFTDTDTDDNARNWFVGPYRSSDACFAITPSASKGGTSPDTTKTLQISYNGNVGIGTTTPTAKLDVDGIITTKGITNMRSIGSKFEVTPVTDGTHNLGNRPSLTGAGNWLEYHSDVDFDFILEMNSPYQVGMWVYLRDKQGNEIQRVHMGIGGSTTASSGTDDPGYEGNNVALFVYNPDKKMYEFAYAEYWYNYGNNASDEAQFNSVIDGAVPTDMIVLNGTGYCSRWMEEVGNTERLRTHFGSTESPYTAGWSSVVFAGIKGYGKILEFDTSSRGVERAAAVKIGDINNDEFLDYQVLWTSNDIPSNRTEAAALDTNDFCFMYNKYGGRIAKMKISQVHDYPSDRCYINLNTVDGTTGGSGFSFDGTLAYFLPFYAKTAVENAGGTWPAGLDAPNAWQTMTWGNDFYWTGSDGRKYYFSLGNKHAGRRRFLSPGTRTRRDDAWPVGSTRGTNLEVTDTHLTIKKRTDGYAYGNQTRMIEFKPFMSDRWNNSGREYHPYTVKASINSGISSARPSLSTEAGFIAFHTADDALNLDERMRIEYNGNVGIGTTSPGYKLHIVNPTLNNSIQDLLCLETHANSQTTIGPAILFRERWNNGSYWNLARILAMEQAGYGGQLAFFTNLGDTGADDTLLERMRIDENGHVGIGTVSPAYQFEVTSSGTCALFNASTAYVMGWNRSDITDGMWWWHVEGAYSSLHRNNYGHCARFYRTSTSSCCVFGDPAIKNAYTEYHTNAHNWDGKLLVGAAPMGTGTGMNNWVANHACVFATTLNLHLESGAGATMYLNHYTDGNVWIDGSVRYTSDDRLKHNEKEVVNALDVINKLDVLTYFKSKKKYAENHHYELDQSGNPITDDSYYVETGLIAQRVKEIPELEYCVSYTDPIYEDDDYSDYAVNYRDIFCFNIKATQELDRKVIALESENVELKTKNTDLENKIATLESELTAIKQHLGI